MTCTATNRSYLDSLAPPGRVELLYHGLDLSRFAPHAGSQEMRDGSDPTAPVQIVSVGRLVEKKGTDVLLDALALLPPGLHWRLVHVGGGPLRAALAERAQRLGISGHIQFRGAMAQDELIKVYREGDLFALASRIASDGDRDGLPNVLMEAQSQGLVCIATDVSAIHELITSEGTGLLVEPESPTALAAGLERLIRSPDLRGTLGAAGQRRVAHDFAAQSNLQRLAAKFRDGPGV